MYDCFDFFFFFLLEATLKQFFLDKVLILQKLSLYFLKMNTVQGFMGLVVHPGKTYTQIVSAPFRIAMVSICIILCFFFDVSLTFFFLLAFFRPLLVKKSLTKSVLPLLSLLTRRNTSCVL